ncbi:MAG: hypothetical protein ONB25_13880 [candidate division KSB1 bacterium]|nr:hypothetical protein [candidate division KSB1 bacterium]
MALCTPFPVSLLAEQYSQYAVGYRDTTFYRNGRTLRTFVYYPATSPGSGTPLNTTGAPYPLLVFAIGKRMQVEYYVTYYQELAASGYVVMAPQFPDVDNPSAYVWNEDIRQCITAALTARTVPGSMFYQAIDANRIGLFGHSFGGGTVIGVAADDGRVRVTCAIAPNNPGNYSFNKIPNVHTPIHILGGELDAINSVDSIGRPLYQRANPDKALVVVKGANHMQFSDYDGFDSVDTPATITRAQQLAITSAHLLNLFDAYLKGGNAARGELYGPSTLSRNDVLLWFETQAGNAARLAYVSGDGQVGLPGQLVPSPIVFKVVDAQGNPLSRHTVHFQITAGGGNLAGQNWRDLETDTNGSVSIQPRLGPSEGTNNNLISVSAYKGTAHLTDSPRVITLSASSQPVRQITVRTVPANLTFSIDGVNYSGQHTFTWPQGSVHAVTVASPQNEAGGTRYVFSAWSDGGAQTHSYQVPARDDTLVATFRTQHLLTLVSLYGSATGAGWYDAGSAATFSVTTPVSGGEGRRFSLTGWTGSGAGSYTGPASSATVTMLGPITETATWHTEFFLATAASPSGGGSVLPSPPGAWFDSSATVSISATPAEGYAWGNWSGDIIGATNPVSFVLTRPSSVTANFVRLSLITIRTEPPGLSFSADSIDYASPHTFAWLPGSVHRVSVTSPQSGTPGVQYLFSSWSDGNALTHNIVAPARDDTLVARFRTQYLLTVNSAHGNPSGGGWYDQGAQAAFRVTTPDSQGGSRHLFVRWTGDFSGTQPTGSLVMTGPKTVTATWRTQYLLTLHTPYATAQGTGWYDEGAKAEFSISGTVFSDSAGTRRVFTGWTGSGEGSYTGPDSAGLVTMNGPITETAQWATHYLLTIASPYGSPQGAGWYLSGTTAHFSVTTPHTEGMTRHIFLRWDGDYQGDEPQGALSMNRPRAVVAEWGTQYFLSTEVDPPGGGAMAPPPPGEWYDANTAVIVHAAASPGFAFGGWDGDLTGKRNPDSLKMDRPKEVTALFVPVGLVRVTSEPEGLELVVDGLPYTTPHDFNWNPGSVHTVQAPSPQQIGSTRYVFQSWNDGGQQTHAIEVSGATVLVARYRTEFFIATSSAPPEGGTVQPSPPGVWVAEKDTVILKAVANSSLGYLFAGWSGDVHSLGNPDTLVVTEPVSVVANFVKVGCTRIGTVPDSLLIIVDGGRYVAPHDFVWEPGSSHTIGVESPQAGPPGVRYVFEGWSDGGAQSHTVVSAETVLYTAFFREEYAVLVKVEPPGAGTVQLIPDSGWYAEGQQVLVKAWPDSAKGYEFERWTGDFAGSTNPATLLINGPKALVAHFVASDRRAPALLYAYPRAGSVWVPTNTSIELGLADSPGGRGLEPSSVAIWVNGTQVAKGGTVLPGHQAVLKVQNGVAAFRYQPTAPFVPSGQVYVRVQARDLAVQTNSLDTTFSFTLAPFPVLVTVSQQLGPEGGFVLDPANGVQIAVPPGALPESTTLVIAQSPGVPPLPDSLLPVGHALYFSPDGIELQDSVTVAIPYTQADLTAVGVNDPTMIPVYRFRTRDGRWDRLRVAGVYRSFLLVPMRSFCYLVFCRPGGTAVAYDSPEAAPARFALLPGFPNPSNSQMVFPIELPQHRVVSLWLYDATGRAVRTIEAGLLPPGRHHLYWDGRDEHGNELPTGVYLVRLRAEPRGDTGHPPFEARTKVVVVR